MGTLGTLDAGYLCRRHVADNQTAHFGRKSRPMQGRLTPKPFPPVYLPGFVFFNPSLNLLLVVYVDDLKMAGPSERDGNPFPQLTLPNQSPMADTLDASMRRRIT